MSTGLNAEQELSGLKFRKNQLEHQMEELTSHISELNNLKELYLKERKRLLNIPLNRLNKRSIKLKLKKAKKKHLSIDSPVYHLTRELEHIKIRRDATEKHIKMLEG